MPKIRGVKPDYWTDDAIVELSIPARLLFIGTWNYACDNGHLEDKSKQIKMRLMPADDVNVADLLRELADNGRIERCDGYITIPNFVRHQKPDKRYFQTCQKPGCTRPEGDSQPQTRSGHHETTTRPPRAHTVGSMGPLGDGDCDGDGEVMVIGRESPHTTSDPAPKKPAAKRRTRLPDDFRPDDEHIKLASSAGVDLRREWPKFVDHWRANGEMKLDWSATLRNWIRRAAEGGPRGVVPSNVVPLDLNGKPILPPPISKDW